ncbi:MAG: diaminopimelate dehydrogenase [Eubacteriaceae bacterium]|nr:diaminopimelate dehydrogenase [Eubacteriaceae bacterium]
MRIAIYGYGNLGRGVEAMAAKNPDVSVTGIFTRRDPSSVTPVSGLNVYPASAVTDFGGDIDVVINCGGSATDLPATTPMLASSFNTVDSFDTHAKIPEHFAAVDAAARQGGNLALISAGWDPGMFSLARVYTSSAVPGGNIYTFWGRGVSQGHSDAIRRIPGVADARQYTVPVPEALEAVRRGECPELTTRDKHLRECWVVAEEGADRAAIEQAIVTMPYYFDEYDTTVNFISEEELLRDHSGLPHGGSVIYNASSGFENEHTHTVEYSLRLDSNPEFTAGVLIACARAVHRMSLRGVTGCISMLDVAPADLSPLSGEELRHLML